MRGGDFLFDSGQGLSLGYESCDPDAVQLCPEESFSFLVAALDGAVGQP
jgi:hypothetical protein